MGSLHASLLMTIQDADRAHIAVRSPDDSGRYASIAIGDLTIIPGHDTNLATVLRRLADRVDDAMAAADTKAVA